MYLSPLEVHLFGTYVADFRFHDPSPLLSCSPTVPTMSPRWHGRNLVEVVALFGVSKGPQLEESPPR